jgi:hypothetical protein
LDPWRVLLILIDYPLEADVRNVLDIQRPLLESRDLIALVSDSSNPMKIGGYQTTQTAYYFVIVQRKSEIETASKVLKEKGYYKNWSPAQLKWLEDRK